MPLRELDQGQGGGDFGFTRTIVLVTLARYGDENLVSLSQAKRLLARFERFKEVIPDFKGLDTIGQTFADEVFRAYPSQYLQVHIVPLNFNDHIENMILGVADRTGSAALRLPGKWRDGKLVSTTKVSRPTR